MSEFGTKRPFEREMLNIGFCQDQTFDLTQADDRPGHRLFHLLTGWFAQNAVRNGRYEGLVTANIIEVSKGVVSMYLPHSDRDGRLTLT